MEKKKKENLSEEKKKGKKEEKLMEKKELKNTYKEVLMKGLNTEMREDERKLKELKVKDKEKTPADGKGNSKEQSEE